MPFLDYAVPALLAAILALQAFTLFRMPKDAGGAFEEASRKALLEVLSQASQDNRALRQELESKMERLRDSLSAILGESREIQQRSISEFAKNTNESLEKISAQLAERHEQALESQNAFSRANAAGLEGMRDKLDERLAMIQSDMRGSLASLLESNEKKLDEMRNTVNEKLERTLETRLQKSFETVSFQLESVNKGLGEMKTVAESVGSLNRVLANAKARGMLGELQLGQIIEDMLPPQLYDKEVATVPGSAERVEYAIKLPGAQEGGHVYLPVDSKFPLEDYYRLMEGYDKGDAPLVEASRKALFARVKASAASIRSKYVSPPDTTSFAILFVPTEGLYSEIVRDPSFTDGLRQEGILVSGPTTLSALINSLQVGFKTLRIQRGAAEIEKTLGSVKKEFEAFEAILKKAHEKIVQAGGEIDKLVGTRTRAINRTLRSVQAYSAEDAPGLAGALEDGER
jgi:DNA recombination protein RmuC